ncbi:DNA-binding transcription factor yap1 [Ascosphaera pollenicola]|nr:DNA-binding transcription factor yap1 [Ascosphaera pollenicola]
MSSDDIYDRITHLTPEERQLLTTALSASDHEKQQSTSPNQTMEGSATHKPQQNAHKDVISHDSKMPGTYLDTSINSTEFDSSLLFDQNGQILDSSLLADFTQPGYEYQNLDNSALVWEPPSPDLQVSVDEDVAQRTSVSDSPSDEPEGGEKRKSADDVQETDGKKRRGDGTAKKPGRKPLTTEPTSKRKAQNRAAQRAFRERKEKHLKDLETKVEMLEKVSKDSRQENSLLRAQVARLQVELQEYRKRMSGINDNTVGRTSFGGTPSNFNPSSIAPGYFGAGSMPQNGMNNITGKDPLSFLETSKSAAQYGSSQQPSWNASPATAAPYTSQNGILSYTTPQSHPSNSHSVHLGNSSSTTPSIEPQNIQKTAPSTSSNGSVKNATHSKHGSPTSCCELVHSNSSTGSPGSTSNVTLDSPLFNQVRHGQDGKPDTHAQTKSSQQQHDPSTYENDSTNKHSQSLCQNMLNEVNQTSGAELGFQQYTDHVPLIPDFDWFVQQNHGAFDPALFGDYRDPQDAYLSHDLDSFLNDNSFDISGGNDTLYDLPPSKPQPLPTTIGDDDLKAFEEACKGKTDEKFQKNIQNLLDRVSEFKRCQLEKAKMAPNCGDLSENQEDYLSLTDLWTRVTQAKSFKEKDLDIDSLCTAFKQKACCSETGLRMKPEEIDKIMSQYE